MFLISCFESNKLAIILNNQSLLSILSNYNKLIRNYLSD